MSPQVNVKGLLLIGSLIKPKAYIKIHCNNWENSSETHHRCGLVRPGRLGGNEMSITHIQAINQKPWEFDWCYLRDILWFMAP